MPDNPTARELAFAVAAFVKARADNPGQCFCSCKTCEDSTAEHCGACGRSPCEEARQAAREELAIQPETP